MKSFFICLCALVAQLAAPSGNAATLDSPELVALPQVPESPEPAPDAGDTLVDDFSDETISLLGYQQSAHSFSVPYFPFGRVHTLNETYCCRHRNSAWSLGAVARGYYLNDQRIRWSGVETTFAAEGAVLAGYQKTCGNWKTSLECELFLNQRFEKNVLFDTPERRSYAANYDLDPLELSRLNLGIRNGDWLLRAGKIWTPFGRYYAQLWTNQLLDAPFIRTEAIHWRETGLLVQYDPDPWIVQVGLFNGIPDRDANSAKALVGRLGAEAANWAVGASVKAQDGSGSESQKIYSRHAGIDAMVRQGRWQFSTEVIYDEYGLRRPNLDPLDIFWKKSIYYRELNEALFDPITGVGYYAALEFTGDLWLVSLNFGQFFPETIGDARHDRTQTRGIIKLARSLGENIQVYSVVMKENEGYVAQDDRARRGTFVLAGLQYTY